MTNKHEGKHTCDGRCLKKKEPDFFDEYPSLKINRGLNEPIFSKEEIKEACLDKQKVKEIIGVIRRNYSQTNITKWKLLNILEEELGIR